MAEPLEKVEIKFIGDSKSLTRAINNLDKATKKLLNTQAKIVDFNKKTNKSNLASRNTLTKMLKSLRENGQSYKTLGINIKTVTSAYKGNTTAIQRLKIAYDRFNKSQKTVNNNNNHLGKGLLDTNHSTRILGGAFSVLRSKLLLFNFMMGLGIRQISQFVSESAKVAGMKTAFNTLSGATNNSAIALKELQKATNGTMSSFDLFQQANNAMILGVADNSETMAEMFDIAQRLGRALGRDTASSVESLITGIGRQSRLMLDNIGIIVKAEEAYENFALANNTTADALTDSQKKQAFLEATMDSARKKVAKLGKENLNAKDSFDQLTTASAELANAVGNALTPQFRSLAKESTTVLTNLKDLVNITFHQKSEEHELALARENGVDVLEKYSDMMKTTTDKSQPLLKQLQSLLKMQKETSRVTLPEGGIFGAGFDSALQTADNIKELEQAIKTLITAQEKYNAVQVDPAVTEAVEFQLNSGKMIARTRKEQAIADQVAFLQAMLNNANRNKLQEGNLKEHTKRLKESKAIEKEVLGNTTQFQLDELSKLRNEYIKHFDMTEEVEKIFYEKRNQIIEEAEKKKQKLLDGEAEKLSELKALEDLIRDDAKQDELDAIDAQAQLMRDAGLNEIAIKQFVADKKQEIDEKYRKSEIDKIKESAKSQLDQFKVVLDFGKKITSQLEKNLDSQVTNEIEALKKTDAYKKASSEQRKTMETQVNSKFAQERKKLFEYNKAVSMGEALIGIADAIIEAMPNPALMALVGAMGAVQLKAISSQKAPTYEQGGLVGGRRHSQGGTMIEAEKGEFVMSRSAVESIGVEAMNQINQGGGAGITVNVTAPLVDETVIDSIIPAIEKAQRLNLA